MINTEYIQFLFDALCLIGKVPDALIFEYILSGLPASLLSP